MNYNNHDTLIGTLRVLNEQGFSSSFQFKNDRMKCLKTGKTYQAKNMCITKHFRFEGASNPSDMSILYAVECEDGNKGTVISSYGMYADLNLGAFIEKMPMKKKKALVSTELS